MCGDAAGHVPPQHELSSLTSRRLEWPGWPELGGGEMGKMDREERMSVRDRGVAVR